MKRKKQQSITGKDEKIPKATRLQMPADLVAHPSYRTGPCYTRLDLQGDQPRFEMAGTSDGSQIIRGTAIHGQVLYYDILKICVDCNRHFIFHAAEQQHLHEDLDFSIGADCIRCVECRKQQQFEDSTHSKYQELMAKDRRNLGDLAGLVNATLNLHRHGKLKTFQKVRAILNQALRSHPDQKSQAQNNMNNGSLPLNLPAAWTKPRSEARLHILRAHASSKAVIIRRKPSKRVHLISWDTASDSLEYGSWFRGRIYSERCDISWDGNWMVYLAMGSNGGTWNGICAPPWLRTIADVPHEGTWAGGGFFSGENKLQSNDVWHSDRSLSEFSNSKGLPFSIERMPSGGEVFPILTYRLERDGWKREGDFGTDQKISLKHSSYAMLCIDDPGWSWRPTPEHPLLRMFYRGYLVHGYTFEFRLEGSDLLDPDVDWATWDTKGDLLVARRGSIYRYTLDDLRNGSQSFSLDLEELNPPARNSQPGISPNA